jgi:predicted molibdopterin-dependent oxidoreductase YjgC
VTEQLDAADGGAIRGLFILGENAAMTDPDLTHVRRCLAACEFLVVQEIFLSETARFAHVVLPAAASAEKAGTFTNTERRIQRFEPAVPAPGDAQPDWWIIAEIGKRVRRMSPAAPADCRYAGWEYASAAEVMGEIAALVPSYGGVSHAGLGDRGLVWPCPSADHPGTPILHVGRFARGRARFTPVSQQPPAESPDAEFPLVLTTGRILEHYHAGTMTRRVPGLNWLAPEAFVEVNPADADRRAIRHGERISVRSRRGSVIAVARVTGTITPGAVFMPFHFAEAAANVLTHAALDPVAKIPEYKVCAVTIEPAKGSGGP